MSAPEYRPTIPGLFKHRLKMCQAVKEGSEMEDIIGALTEASYMLHAFEDFYCEMVLLIAEQLCRDFIRQHYWNRECGWEEYQELDENVYMHFTGGACKLSEEEFKRLKGDV